MMVATTRIAIFASGTGSNALHLLEEAQRYRSVEMALLVVDQPQAAIIESAKKHYPNLKQLHVFGMDRREREAQILQALKLERIDWCFLAGYMRILSADFIEQFKILVNSRGGLSRRYAPIVNLHPSLLPKHPGLHAIEKTFDGNDDFGGVTLHLVDAGVDTGPILLQKRFQREEGETLARFTQKIKKLEQEAYSLILKMVALNATLICISEPDDRSAQLFWVYYSGPPLTESDWNQMAPQLCDSVDQVFLVHQTPNTNLSQHFIEFLPGVTDNAAHAFQELLGFEERFQGREIFVASGIWRASDLAPKVNPLIQKCTTFTPPDPRLKSISLRPWEFPADSSIEVKRFPLVGLSVDDLETLSRSQHWALSGQEMRVIQEHFSDRAPTDVEMEILAQTWSEHCKHKIFRAEIDYVDTLEPAQSRKIRGLFKEYIQNPTEKLKKAKPWLVSVFSDNAGIVRFFKNVDVCVKVETHNSPSALDPYGGALTGILGVNRDILGTGLGAKPIANTNVLCFGNPNEIERVPLGLFPPREVLAGVHRGVQDGGNKSGIPTVNGAFVFDESYSGKPLVYCGTVGVMPQEVHGTPSHLKGQRAGDRIVVVGGSVGLDGIHGATSSSLGLDATIPTGMVQIGDPLTQKRVLDFVLRARDLGLYNSITDNGAGGISSSIGEMAVGGELNPGGAKIDLSRVPTKYPGLQPWQLMISESQERMTLSVPLQKLDELFRLARSLQVQAVDIGEFTQSGLLEVSYGSQKVAELSLQFLHDGLPQMKLRAQWNGPRQTPRSKNSLRLPLRPSSGPKEHLLKLAAHPSLKSKEAWIRQYDHEVQAATVKKPFEGTHPDAGLGKSAPNEGAVIWMGAHGAKDQSGQTSMEGLAIGSGICAHYSDLDPYWMGVCAADEAVRNVIVAGADPERIALTDNFCWPDPIISAKNPDGDQKLAELVRTCMGLERVVMAYQTPLVSGKDSMKNDFYGHYLDGSVAKISVLPTLLVTAIAHHPDVQRVVAAHFKPGQKLYRLGQFWDAENFDPLAVAHLYRRYFRCVQSGLIQAARDLSEGGLAFAVVEGLLLHRSGIHLKVETSDLFSESPGQFVIAVSSEHESELRAVFTDAELQSVGQTDDSAQLGLKRGSALELLRLEEFEVYYRGAVT
jgi:phosphoribosylformylglycinamidine synthase II